MNLFLDEIKNWEGFEMVVEKVETLIEKFKVCGIRVYQSNAKGDGYNILNHGNFRLNNLMFKNGSDGKISDVLFVSLFRFYTGFQTILTSLI